MKFTSTTSLLSSLLALTSASPLLNTRQNVAAANAINQWNQDVTAVNEFLNSALSSANPSSDAIPILQTALDEPVQLMALTALLTPEDSASEEASSMLSVFFPMVPQALMAIVAADNNPKVVAAQVDIINNVRCNTVLPNIGILWATNGFSAGTVAVPLGPSVCPTPGSNHGPYPIIG